MIFDHPFFMVGYASVAWFMIIFTITKNRNEVTFSTTKWLGENWDDFLLTLVMGAALVIYDDEILRAYNDWTGSDHPVVFRKYFYLLPGPFTDGLIRMVKFIKRNGR